MCLHWKSNNKNAISIVMNTKLSTMKALFTLLFFSFTMGSCVYDEELANATSPYTDKQETPLSYSMETSIPSSETPNSRSIPYDAFAHVRFRIQNHMPDLHLVVEGIRLCNIHLSGTYHFATETQVHYWETDSLSTLSLETGQLKLAPNDEISFPQEGNISFIPQITKTWIPITLPQDSNECYLLLNCKVFNDITIWSDGQGNCAEVAIPLSINLQSNQPSVIVLTLEPNCPWYNIQGSAPEKILVPIIFNASVDDWEE
jgi:hypothetical protein